MAKNFADDTNVEVLEKELPEDTTIQDDAVIQDDAGVEEKPAEEEVQAEAVVEATPEPDGPTPAMQELAKQWLPDKLIGIATDDKQLQGMIEMAREEGTAPPAKEEKDFELSLPEEEFEAGDAVRKQFSALNDFYKGKFQQSTKDMQTLVGIVKNIQGQQEAQVQNAQFEEQRGFDEELDAMDNDVVGKFGAMSDGQGLIREALYKQAQSLKDKKGGTLRSHVAEVAKLVRAETKQQKQAYQSKVKEQSNGRLGTGNSQRMPELEKSRVDKMGDFLVEIGKRHGNKE